MITCQSARKEKERPQKRPTLVNPLHSGLQNCKGFARAMARNCYSFPPPHSRLSPSPLPLVCGSVLRVPQGFQGFAQWSLSGAPPRGDGLPKGHLVQTTNLFDALFVFSSSFLFSSLPPAPLVTRRPLTLSPQPLAS